MPHLTFKQRILTRFCILTQEKKLFNLWKKQTDKCPDCMKNFSEKKLNIQEQNALKYDLNHPILSRQVQKDKIRVAVEQLVYKLKRNTNVSLNQEIMISNF